MRAIRLRSEEGEFSIGSYAPYVDMLIRNKQLQYSEKPLPIAVAVSEKSPAIPGDLNAGMTRGKTEPRLVVIGNAQWASNSSLSPGGAGDLFYDMFASSLAWLRDRPRSIGIEPRQSDLFVLEPGTNYWRMFLLPTGLAFLGIIGLGTGVWLIRRR